MTYLDLITKVYTLVKNKSTVPRWMIFIVDLVICAFSLFSAYFLRFNLDIYEVYSHGFVPQIFVVTGLNIIFFVVFRTYEGIIRLSSVQEVLRCVSAVFFSAFVLFISTFISDIFGWPYLVPTSVLIIYFFVASFLIFDYRVWVKKIYHMSIKGTLALDNVFVYCKTINAVVLKNAIESIPDRRYRVIGFIDDHENVRGKSIDNARFYSFDKTKISASKLFVKFVFVAADEPDVGMRRRIVDFCLARNINVKVIPEVKNWIDGQLKNTLLKDLRIEDLLGRPGIKLASEHVSREFEGKRILVTGAAGSIGSEIVKQLLGINVELLIVCDNRETGLFELEYQLQQISGKKHRIVTSVSDVKHYSVMQRLFEAYKPQIVFHAAAYKHVPLMELHPCEAIKNNVHGTKVVADLSVMYGIEKFVLISTDKAINPTNVMGATKRVAEMYVSGLNSIKTKFIITRFGNVLGSNGSVIPRFHDQIDKGGPVTVTHPEIIRYFMTIPEACSLVLEAGTMGNGGEVFVFDMGEPVKITDLANKMIRLAGLVPGRDIQIEFTGLRPGEKLFEELLYKNEEVIPTHHKKIMISKVSKAGLGQTLKHVDHLIELVEIQNDLLAVKQMKLIVTEYKSKNSAFEILDTKEVSEFIS